MASNTAHLSLSAFFLYHLIVTCLIKFKPTNYLIRRTHIMQVMKVTYLIKEEKPGNGSPSSFSIVFLSKKSFFQKRIYILFDKDNLIDHVTWVRQWQNNTTCMKSLTLMADLKKECHLHEMIDAHLFPPNLYCMFCQVLFYNVYIIFHYMMSYFIIMKLIFKLSILFLQCYIILHINNFKSI